jgi:Zn finger protein HypA/HybF involved in hydrogenase expression
VFRRFAFTIGAMIRRMTLVWLLCASFATLKAADGEAPAPASFIRAITSGDTVEVTRQLESGVSPDARDEEGTNALYLACDKEQPAIAQLLVARGADVNLLPKTKGRSTALQVAIYRGFDSYALKPREGYPQLIKMLIEKGADVNAADVDGNTPLIAAAEKDDVATMRLLLAKGANLAHTNENGWTALERAVSYRRRTIARELVTAGAPLDAEQQKLKQRYEFARKAGSWFPWILVGSLVLAGLMRRQFKTLPKRTVSPRLGDDLPKLQPLKCHACGGSASLRPGVAQCSRCHGPVPVPADYADTLKLREQTFKLMEKAERLWKRVRLISVRPVRLALWIAAIWFVIYMWKGLFPHFVRDAFHDLMTFKGTMVWALGVLTMSAMAIALGGYAIYLGEVRRALPAPPVKRKDWGTAEEIGCANCGGMVSLKPGDIACICGYCGSETYRVALAREARVAATGERHEASESLYQAMTRVYELRENAALAVPAAIVVIGFVLVTVLYVILLFI